MVEILTTYMEAFEPLLRGPVPSPDERASVVEVRPALADYLALYRAVGGPVRWDGDRTRSADEIAAFLADPAVRLFLCRLEAESVGFCEFDGRRFPDVELTHFGLVPSAQGRGLGRFLLDRALRAVWASSPRRIWLHTDTWDHRAALPTYRSAGFAVSGQRWEFYPD